jgi:hypothetical protein
MTPKQLEAVKETGRKTRNLQPGRIWLTKKAPQCVVIKRSGERCKAPAMRGARRCYYHGGAYEVPEHPTSRRLLREGKLDLADARVAAVQKWRMTPEENKQAVEDVAGPWTARRSPLHAEGAEAIGAIDQDGGAAWRAFVKKCKEMK